MNVPNNTLKCSGLTEQKDGTELARAKGNRNIVPFRFRSVFPGNCSDWVLEHELVAFGVLHVQSGRFDGWYFDHDEAAEMLDFFRNEFPGNEFELVGRVGCGWGWQMMGANAIAFVIPGEPQGKGPSIARLQEVFVYQPQTGVLSWRVRMGARGIPGSKAGSGSAQGYQVVGVDGRRNLFVHRIAWAIHYGEWPAGEVDHINGDRSDNRIANLRDVATHQNHQNMRKARSDNKTGLLGVSPHKGRFRAQIQADGRKRWIGEFDTAQAAYSAYVNAKRELHSHGTI